MGVSPLSPMQSASHSWYSSVPGLPPLGKCQGTGMLKGDAEHHELVLSLNVIPLGTATSCISYQLKALGLGQVLY